MYTAGPAPTPLPSAKSGRPPPTPPKFCSPAPPTGLRGVKTLECEHLKTTGFFVKHTTKELEIAPVPLQQNSPTEGTGADATAHHAGGVNASTCPSPAAEYRHGCPSPRRTWWRRNATVQVGVALPPHGLTVPSEAGTA
eukprot:scaffold10155_cov117-Isochrysis_galbana.AAC.2